MIGFEIYLNARLISLSLSFFAVRILVEFYLKLDHKIENS